jgi:hypothetical protein
MHSTNSFAEQNYTVLHGSMQNQAGPKNMCKKTRETCAGQSLMRLGVFSISRASEGAGFYSYFFIVGSNAYTCKVMPCMQIVT